MKNIVVKVLIVNRKTWNSKQKLKKHLGGGGVIWKLDGTKKTPKSSLNLGVGEGKKRADNSKNVSEDWAFLDWRHLDNPTHQAYNINPPPISIIEAMRKKKKTCPVNFVQVVFGKFSGWF